jgi:arylsulfatase A-like enzyme
MTASQPASQPDIILVLIDDLGWRDLTCYGSTFHETPNLDRLARSGLTCTDGYATCPVCSPSRASVMTGKAPARVGITNYIPGNAWGRLMGVDYVKNLPKQEVTIAARLRQQGGYRTAHVGKWHLGADEACHPHNVGFEVNLGGCEWGHPHHGYQAPWRMPTLPEGQPGEWLTPYLTRLAIQQLEKPDPRPIFLNLWHYTVHTPIQAPAHLIAKYRAKAARLGLDKAEAIIDGELVPCINQIRYGKRVQRRVLQSDPVYAAMMEELDDSIGALIAAQERRGRLADTLFIFTSDNGGLATSENSPTCNAPLAEGKGWIEEGGVRVPFIAAWPGRIAPGSVSHEPVWGADIYPTLLSAAGLPLDPAQHADGVDLLPLMTRGEAPKRDAICWHYPHYSPQGGTPACAIRSGDWKLVEWFETGRVSLYDLRRDPSEAFDRAAQQPAITARLLARLRAWRDEVAAQIPKPNPHYEDMLAGRKPHPNGNGVVG